MSDPITPGPIHPDIAVSAREVHARLTERLASGLLAERTAEAVTAESPQAFGSAAFEVGAVSISSPDELVNVLDRAQAFFGVGAVAPIREVVAKVLERLDSTQRQAQELAAETRMMRRRTLGDETLLETSAAFLEPLAELVETLQAALATASQQHQVDQALITALRDAILSDTTVSNRTAKGRVDRAVKNAGAALVEQGITDIPPSVD